MRATGDRSVFHLDQEILLLLTFNFMVLNFVCSPFLGFFGSFPRGKMCLSNTTLSSCEKGGTGPTLNISLKESAVPPLCPKGKSTVVQTGPNNP